MLYHAVALSKSLLKWPKEPLVVRINQSIGSRLAVAIVSCAMFVSLTISFLCLRTNAGHEASSQRNNQTVIFAIAGEGGDYHMDAVALVNGKRFVSPFSDEQKDRQKSFAEKYFAKGRQYRLIFGGSGAGTVAVTKWTEGCNIVHAEVNVTTSAHLGGKVRALATNSDTLGKRASARRAPTDAERSAVMKLVKSIYQQHRTPANLIASINVTNLTATDLDGDGKYELIGSFTLAAKNKFERDLFLIAKGDSTSMRADLAEVQGYQPPSEGFLHSIDYVEQLDVDGDGIGEVFAIQGGFDGYGYLIFKKGGSRWRRVYDQMGDAC
jgi:hypothetical protein